MNKFNIIGAIPLTIFTKSKFKNSTKIREDFSSLFQMWDTKSSTLAIDKSAAGRIDRPQRRSGKCNRGRSSGISPRKVYGWNFGQRVKGGGKPGADGKNRLSRGARKRRVRIGKGLTNTGEYIRVHVGIFAIKLTRKQRLCQRHRAPLDRYIFISISRMFLKPYRRGTSHMGHIFHNDVLAYTLENARPTWYRVNWNAPVCFARANRSPMRELYSKKKKKYKIYETYMRCNWERTRINNRLWSWKVADISHPYVDTQRLFVL